jgi:hypothetical protein
MSVKVQSVCLDPINGPRSFEIQAVELGVKIIVNFSNDANTVAFVSWKDLVKILFLSKKEKLDLSTGNLKRIYRTNSLRNIDALHFYFIPVNGCDLVLVEVEDFRKAILLLSQGIEQTLHTVKIPTNDYRLTLKIETKGPNFQLATSFSDGLRVTALISLEELTGILSLKHFQTYRFATEDLFSVFCYSAFSEEWLFFYFRTSRYREAVIVPKSDLVNAITRLLFP